MGLTSALTSALTAALSASPRMLLVGSCRAAHTSTRCTRPPYPSAAQSARIAEVDAQLEAQSAKAEPGFGRRKREHGIHGSHPTGLHPA